MGHANGVCPYCMRVKKRGEDEWWILGIDQLDEGMGPYPSKEEAEWHMHAVENTWKYGDRPGYFTVDKDKRTPMPIVPREPEPEPPKRRVRKPSTTAPVRKKRRKSRKRK